MFVYLDFDMLYGKFELCYKIYKLCDVFNEFDIYDVVYIDMLFVLNFYMCLVLIVVECCLILFDCDDFLCCVLYMLFENVKEIQQDYNVVFEVEGIVLCCGCLCW